MLVREDKQGIKWRPGQPEKAVLAGVDYSHGGILAAHKTGSPFFWRDGLSRVGSPDLHMASQFLWSQVRMSRGRLLHALGFRDSSPLFLHHSLLSSEMQVTDYPFGRLINFPYCPLPPASFFLEISGKHKLMQCPSPATFSAVIPSVLDQWSGISDVSS